MTNTASIGGTQHIRIQLLGGFSVSVGTRIIAEVNWRRRKAKSLVKLLALAHGHRLHREQVMDRLWPDLDSEMAANNLHQVLHIARRILDSTGKQGTRYLELRDEILTLCPEEPLWVDVNAFEVAAAEARRNQSLASYQAALDLYTGDLLPEDRYDDWVNNRREKLRQEYQDLLLELAQQFEVQKEYIPARQTLQQLLAVDPTHEEAHTTLMRLYALMGQRQQALRQYQLLKEALWRELEVEPEPKNQRLYDNILAGHFSPDEESGGGRARVLRNQDKEISSAPSLSLPRAPLHNLPIQLTRFIGREQEKAEVMRLQTITRLLMLTGPGGCGKTRLALEVAAGLHAANAYPDGVWLAELAALSDPALVPQVIASALNLRETPGQPLTETLVTYLQSKQLLLVVDNCEHLIEACAKLAATLVRACPDLRILATSREPLRIPGELIWPVPPLSMPNPQQLPPLQELIQYEAVQLIIDRATANLPTFTVTQYNAPAVAQICHELDGLPLALELAAARVRVLTMAQIAARLEDRFRLLVGGNRLVLTRQQTLKATLDWSYELLLEQERILFQRLAIFAGGFTLEAAQVICADERLDEANILDLLSQLMDKSLVTIREEGQERRYGLLETIRQYSAEKLRLSGEEAKIRTQHQAWYLALAEQAEPELFGASQAEWLARLEPELDNLRLAWVWSKPDENGDGTGLRLARALFWFCYLGSYLTEGRTWFENALVKTDTSQRTWMRATALFGSGALAMYQGDLITARQRLEESIAIWRELNNKSELAISLFILVTVTTNQGDELAAFPLVEECLALFRELGQEPLYAFALLHLGDIALSQGDCASARTRYKESLTLQRKAGHQWGTAQALNNLGEVARCEKNYDQAAGLYKEGLALFREVGSSGDVARSLHNLGYVAQAQGDTGLSATLFSESLALFQERGNKRGIVECLAGLAGVAKMRSDFWRAAQLLGAVGVQFEAIGAAMWPADRLEYERHVATVQAALGEEDFAAAWTEGRMLILEQAIELTQVRN